MLDREHRFAGKSWQARRRIGFGYRRWWEAISPGIGRKKDHRRHRDTTFWWMVRLTGSTVRRSSDPDLATTSFDCCYEPFRNQRSASTTWAADPSWPPANVLCLMFVNPVRLIEFSTANC